MRMSDWSSDVCSSELVGFAELQAGPQQNFAQHAGIAQLHARARFTMAKHPYIVAGDEFQRAAVETATDRIEQQLHRGFQRTSLKSFRSEEHTSELQSLMRSSYAVFCLKKKNIHTL